PDRLLLLRRARAAAARAYRRLHRRQSAAPQAGGARLHSPRTLPRPAGSGYMKRSLAIVLALAVAIGAAVYYTWSRAAHDLVLTGIVTTDDVVVSAEVQGRLQELSVNEGDTVQRGQLLGLIQPQEWKADVAYYASSEQQSAAQVAEAEAALRYQESQTSNQTEQAEANLAAARAQVVQGQ